MQGFLDSRLRGNDRVGIYQLEGLTYKCEVHPSRWSVDDGNDFSLECTEPYPAFRPLILDMAQENEQNCIQQAQAGDREACAELFRRYWRAARATAYGVLGDLNLAEDAAAEAFYTALKDLRNLRDPQRFGPWLRTIVTRTAKGMGAVNTRQQRMATPKSPTDSPPSPPEALEQREMGVLLQEAVGRLSPCLREAVSLFYFEGYDLAEGARFLDIPIGTFKRRLHDGRTALRDIIEKIAKEGKAMDTQREEIIQQLQAFVEQGGGKKTMAKLMHQGLGLHPAPIELLQKVVRKHMQAGVAELQKDPAKQQWFNRTMQQFHGPSARALDPQHPVGAVVEAIRAACPECQDWPMSPAPTVASIREYLEQPKSGQGWPPGFAEGRPGSYIRMTRGLLLMRPDGSIATMGELLPDSKQADDRTFVSDTLNVHWLRNDALDLHTLETWLRRVAAEVLPETSVRFQPLEVPMFRSILRMEFEGQIIPAVVGGVRQPLPEQSRGCDIALLTFHLEAWATIHSGRPVELQPFPLEPPQ